MPFTGKLMTAQPARSRQEPLPATAPSARPPQGPPLRLPCAQQPKPRRSAPRATTPTPIACSAGGARVRPPPSCRQAPRALGPSQKKPPGAPPPGSARPSSPLWRPWDRLRRARRRSLGTPACPPPRLPRGPPPPPPRRGASATLPERHAAPLPTDAAPLGTALSARSRASMPGTELQIRATHAPPPPPRGPCTAGCPAPAVP